MSSSLGKLISQLQVVRFDETDFTKDMKMSEHAQGQQQSLVVHFNYSVVASQPYFIHLLAWNEATFRGRPLWASVNPNYGCSMVKM